MVTAMEATNLHPTVKSEGTQNSAGNITVDVHQAENLSESARRKESIHSESNAPSKDGGSIKDASASSVTIGDDDDDDDCQITHVTSKKEEVIKAAKRKGAIELDGDDESDNVSESGAKRLSTGRQNCYICTRSFRHNELRKRHFGQEQVSVCPGCYKGLVALQNSERNEAQARMRPLEEKECTICLETVESWRIPKPKHAEAYGCESQACLDCWREHLQSEVNSKDVDSVQCPDCVYVLEADDMRVLATDETYDLWSLKAAKAFAEKDAEYRACPAGKCSFTGLFVANDNYNLFVCPECNCRFCMTCNVPFHNAETCAEYRARRAREEQQDNAKKAEDDRLTQEEVDKSSKPCPKCSMRCQKISGCDHVACLRPSCRHHFNWCCLADYEGSNGTRTQGAHMHRRDCANYTPFGGGGWFETS